MSGGVAAGETGNLVDQHLPDFPLGSERSDTAQIMSVAVFGVPGEARGFDHLDDLPAIFHSHLFKLLDLACGGLSVCGNPCQNGNRDTLGFPGRDHV